MVSGLTLVESSSRLLRRFRLGLSLLIVGVFSALVMFWFSIANLFHIDDLVGDGYVSAERYGPIASLTWRGLLLIPSSLLALAGAALVVESSFHSRRRYGSFFPWRNRVAYDGGADTGDDAAGGAANSVGRASTKSLAVDLLLMAGILLVALFTALVLFFSLGWSVLAGALALPVVAVVLLIFAKRKGSRWGAGMLTFGAAGVAAGLLSLILLAVSISTYRPYVETLVDSGRFALAQNEVNLITELRWAPLFFAPPAALLISGLLLLLAVRINRRVRAV